MRLLALLVPLLAGCPNGSGNDSGNGNVSDCSQCGDGTFCLVHAQGDFDSWTQSCQDVPSSCAQPPSCDNCAGTMYDLCPDANNVVSWACSDTTQPVIITCGY